MPAKQSLAKGALTWGPASIRDPGPGCGQEPGLGALGWGGGSGALPTTLLLYMSYGGRRHRWDPSCVNDT